ARNHSTDPVSIKVRHEVYDYLNRRVASGSSSFDIPGRATAEQPLDLDPGATGSFRVLTWVENVDDTLDEMVFSVQPHARTVVSPQSGLFGVHADFTDFQFRALRRLGTSWVRTTSPSRAFRWSTAE